MSAGFTVDLNRCTGCQACVVACWMEHRSHQTQAWRQVHAFNGFHHPDLPCFHLSLACHHCERPACLAQCPARAYTRDPRTVAVIIHAERCMGCRYCTWACPHDAPKFDPRAHTIEKCTFCEERLAEGQEPACVARCPVEALGLEAERSAAPAPDVPGFPASDLRPGVRFIPLRHDAPPESAALAPARTFLDQVLTFPESKITLRGEWSLVVFTTVLSGLVGWQTASVLGGPAVQPLVFLGLGAGAMALSAWHLGHPERAWRAVLNAGSSWLSREILLVSAFLLLADLAGFQVRGLAWAAALTGLAALFSVDRIYRVALQQGPWNLHSAHTLLNGLYLAGWLARLWPLVIGAGTVKALLYAHRKWRGRRLDTPARRAVSLLRGLAGFVVPIWLPPGADALSVVLGDLVDRCEYYDELEIPSPQREVARELRSRLG